MEDNTSIHWSSVVGQELKSICSVDASVVHERKREVQIVYGSLFWAKTIASARVSQTGGEFIRDVTAVLNKERSSQRAPSTCVRTKTNRTLNVLSRYAKFPFSGTNSVMFSEQNNVLF